MRNDYHRKQKVYRKKPAAALFITVCVLSLLSCPNPIEEVMVEHAKDDTVPVITIISPVERGFYASTVTISGTVTDAADANGAAGKVETLACRIKGEEDEQDIDFDESGGFACTVQTGGYSGEIEILLRATDWNGNVGTTELTLVDNGVGPQVAISTPEDSSYYAATVIVQGTVANSQTDSGIDEIASLSYEVLSSSIGDALTFDDGTFSFQFPTSGLEGNLVIRITAEDHNGNTTERDLTLIDGGSGIPTLTVSPGNQQATLEWDPVPLAESYTVYYETGDILPEPGVSRELPNAESPLTVNSLTNGRIHTFQLQAVSSSGDDNWSEVKKAMPLSRSMLTPHTYAGKDDITIDWRSLSGVDEYRVYRASSYEGPYEDISGTISLTCFEDTSPPSLEPMYYAVQPAKNSDILSWPKSAARMPFTAGEDKLQADIRTGANADCLAYDYPYLYVGHSNSSENKLKVIDITNPAVPIAAGSVSVPGVHYDMVKKGDYIYIAAGAGGLQVVDVSDPSNPAVVGSCSSSFGSQSVLTVAYYNNVVYIGVESVASSARGGIEKIDITAPSSPQPTNEKIILNQDGSNTLALAVGSSGNYVFATTAWAAGGGPAVSNSFFAVDTSTMSNQYKTGFTTAGADKGYDIAIEGDTAYIAGMSNNCIAMNISDPTTMSEMGYVNPNPSTAWGITVADNKAYIANRESGLLILDVADPANMSAIDTVTTADYQCDIVLDYPYAYVADASGGVRVFDVKAPSSADITQVGSYTMEGLYVNGQMQIRGNRLYLYTAGGDSMEIVDVSTKSTPQKLDGYSVTNGGYGMSVQGDYVFLTSGGMTGILEAVPIENDTFSDSVSEMVFPNYNAEENIVTGNYLYQLSDYNSSTYARIFDISNPTSPAGLGQLEVALMNCVCVTESTLYVVGSDATLTNNEVYVFDISNPAEPVQAGSYSWSPSTAEINDVHYRNDHLYIAEGDELTILNVADPASITEAATITKSSPATGVYTAAGYAFVVFETDGFGIWDVNDPATPSEKVWVAKDGSVTGMYDIAVQGQYCYVVQDDRCIIYRIYQ